MNTKEEITEQIEILNDEKDNLENGENTDEYDAMLDDCHPVVKIGNLEYSPSQVLKNVDEIAYNCGLIDYNDSRLTEINEEIEQLETELKDLEEEEKEVLM
jgi:DNA repair exonuclease SbcCD ATPase subunit